MFGTIGPMEILIVVVLALFILAPAMRAARGEDDDD